MSKLTLSVEESVVARAKRFAEKRGTSVSALVERYLAELTRSRPVSSATSEMSTELAAAPITARLSGLLRGRKVDPNEYRLYLERKFR